MIERIFDRKSNYKLGELKKASTFTEEQEEKIRRAQERHFGPKKQG